MMKDSYLSEFLVEKKWSSNQVHILKQLHQRLWETQQKHERNTNNIRVTYAPSQADATYQIFHTDGLQI